MSGAGHIALKEKHPTWFKMKIERRQLLKEIPPESAVNVLLACWEYLETMEVPKDLAPMEKIAFSAFFPDMEEAWSSYEQRINARKKGGSNDNGRYLTISDETEEETEEDSKNYKIPPKVPQGYFSPALEPVVEEWVAYKREKRQPYKATGLKNLCTTIQHRVEQYGEAPVIQVIRDSMGANYQGICWDKLKNLPQQATTEAPEIPEGLHQETGPDGLTIWVRT